MNISAEKLIAYVDGELTGDERAEVDAALASDAALRDRVQRERDLRRRLSAAFDTTLEENVPLRLTSAVTKTADNVVAFSPKRAGWTYRDWGAMAASLAGGLVLGLGVMSNQAQTITSTPDGLVARGALAQALETQRAANVEGVVRIGISFQARDGAYCRTFGVQRDHLAGLACKQGEQWRVPITAQLVTPAGEIRTAGSDTPAPILAAVDQMISGDAFDVGAEAAARRRHWRASD